MTDQRVDDLIRRLEADATPDRAFVARTFDLLEPRVRRARRDASRSPWGPRRWLLDGLAGPITARDPARPAMRLLLVVVAVAVAVTGLIVVAGSRPRHLATIPPAPLPSAILSSTAPSQDPTNAGHRWVWSDAAAMLEPRTGHTATLLLDGRVLVTGGRGADRAPLASAEIFDPVAGSWTSTGPMRWARTHHAAVRLADGRVLVAAGMGSNAAFVVELWDPATGRWTETGPPVHGATQAALAALPDGRVLMSSGSQPRGETELLDPQRLTWSPAGALTVPRYNHALVTLSDGSVLLVGGDHRADVPVLTLEQFEPGTGTWTAIADLPRGAHSHGAIPVPGGDVLIPSSRERVHLFVVTSGEVRQVTRTIPADDRPALVGDWVVPFRVVDGVGLFDPRTTTWTEAAPDRRQLDGALTLLATGQLLVSGGTAAVTGDVTAAAAILGPGG